VRHSPIQGLPKSTELPTFHKGDHVVLAKGSYQGRVGIFLKLKNSDPTWADILEQNSQVRSHLVEWLQHSVWLHAIGVIQRIEGSPRFAEAKIQRHRKSGHSSAYLFAAKSEEEFKRKELVEIARLKN
jgi:hypothetical protein